MSNYKTMRRFSLEIEKINRGQFPSFEEIRNYLDSHDIDISPRTLQRDIEQIRYGFNLVIKYDRHKNGYYIDKTGSLNIESFFRFLEIVNTAELLSESLKDSTETLNHISFDAGGGLKGIDNLQPLLKAIKDKRKVKFDHFNFHTGKTKPYTLKPYLLKEYQNRWYLIGILGTNNEFRTFGIDRVENLEVQVDTFKPNKKLKPKENFENTIGIVYSLNKQEKVVLSFTPTQGKYNKSLPMHKSQLTLVDDENEYQISLDVVPNFELTQLIMMYGDAVKVIEPKWLAEEILERLRG